MTLGMLQLSSEVLSCVGLIKSFFLALIGCNQLILLKTGCFINSNYIWINICILYWPWLSTILLILPYIVWNNCWIRWNEHVLLGLAWFFATPLAAGYQEGIGSTREKESTKDPVVNLHIGSKYLLILVIVLNLWWYP